MDFKDPPDLPLPQRLALGYGAGAARAMFGVLFAFDARLSQLVAQANEPILAQIRLAWWRDELGKPVSQRARGDPILDALGQHWTGAEAALQNLVSGWEELLAEPPLPDTSAMAFADGRARAFAGLAGLLGEQAAIGVAREAAQRWALVDLWGKLSTPEERELVAGLASQHVAHSSPVRLPRSMRPLAVLDGLARRAAKRGDPEMLGSRQAMLAVLRLGMFGR
ncbi:MAG: hypothetical protein H6918_08350 [Sphingomonadaceae bacterium]|nr:hypothetical protein [Sphingomonadaceae bacterium]